MYFLKLGDKEKSFSCRKELREQLKRQIEEKCVALKLQLASKVKEAEYIREVDRLALSSEREQRIQHRKAMTAYRDENKRVKSHTCIIYPLLMHLGSGCLQLCPFVCSMFQHAGCSQVTTIYVGSVWGFSLVSGVFVCVCMYMMCAANGAELEGQSTNTLPGAPEGERAAAPQPN